MKFLMSENKDILIEQVLDKDIPALWGVFYSNPLFGKKTFSRFPEDYGYSNNSGGILLSQDYECYIFWYQGTIAACKNYKPSKNTIRYKTSRDFLNIYRNIQLELEF